jgi:hypothetical protein
MLQTAKQPWHTTTSKNQEPSGRSILPRLQTVTMAFPGADNQINAAMDQVNDAGKYLEYAAMDLEDAQMGYEDAQMDYNNAARELARVGGVGVAGVVSGAGVVGVGEELDESPAELYMEDLRAAEEERVSAYLAAQRAEAFAPFFAPLLQAATTLAELVTEFRPPPPRSIHVIVADIRNVLNHMSDALAALRETETGIGGNINEEAPALAPYINERLEMARHFLSVLLIEQASFDPQLQGPAHPFGNAEDVPLPNGTAPAPLGPAPHFGNAAHVPVPNAARAPPEPNNRGNN